MKQARFWLPLLLGLALLLPCASNAQDSDVFSFETAWFMLHHDHGLADLPEMSFPAQILVLTLVPGPGYHAYAHLPGADVPETSLSLGFSPLPDHAVPAQIRYLPGTSTPDVFDPQLTVNVYAKDTPIFVIFDGSPGIELELNLTLLACSDHNCVPVRANLTSHAPHELSPLPPDLLEQLRNSSPGAFLTTTPAASTAVEPGQTALPPDLAALLPGFAQSTTPNDQADELALPVISTAPLWSFDFNPRPFQASLEVTGLGKAWLFGLLAGLILNFMPCVLPVLTMKISTLLTAGGDADQRQRNFREHNLFFSAGILTWFAALALLFGLAGLAWGQIFQSPVVVFALLLLVFALGLSMFDVFHLPVLDLRLGNSQNPRLQAYGTGLMATLLATPCSGPLLGGVLGWSLMQGLPVLVTVFVATGLGMALPYLIMAAFPKLANLLPRPGAWMRTFERIMGFLLMATCVYLLSILPDRYHLATLIALLLTAFAAWIWGKYGSLRAEGLKKAVLGALCLALVGLGSYLVFAPRQTELLWREFEAAEFSQLLGTENLFVEFTADWCPTCKVLEQTSLTAANLNPLIRQHNLTLIRVDMTEFDQDAQDLLRALNSASIPLLAIFPAGEQANSPLLLRDLYTAAQMREAVAQALAD